jgi:hypothetical protein
LIISIGFEGPTATIWTTHLTAPMGNHRPESSSWISNSRNQWIPALIFGRNHPPAAKAGDCPQLLTTSEAPKMIFVGLRISGSKVSIGQENSVTVDLTPDSIEPDLMDSRDA